MRSPSARSTFLNQLFRILLAMACVASLASTASMAETAPVPQLAPQDAEEAPKIPDNQLDRYNPDKSWKPTDDDWPEEDEGAAE